MRHIAGRRASVATRSIGGRAVEHTLYIAPVQQNRFLASVTTRKDGTRLVSLQEGVDVAETVDLPSQGIRIHLDATGRAVSVEVA